MKRINWAEPQITNDEVEAVSKVVKSGWVGGNGPTTKLFEKEFARTVGAKYAIAVCNGTCGLLLALLALKRTLMMNISVPTWTFIATANTAQLFGWMELIDCDRRTHNIDPTKIPKYSNVIMPVDVGGVPVDYDALRNLPFPHITLADSAESLGAIYKGKKLGELADIHLYSLHAAKIITSGEGGVLTTNNKKFYELMKSINNQGYGKSRKPWEYHHSTIGFNFRITEMQSALGLVQLRKLPKFLKRRIEFAHIYHDILGNKVGYQEIPKYSKSSYFLFSILVDHKRRDKIVQNLIKQGISVKTWKPVHLQPPYINRKGIIPYSLTNSEYLTERVINLPIHNNLTEELVKLIGERVLREVK